MADIEASLRTLTLQHANIAAAFSDRFFWNHIPEGVTTYPSLRAQVISDPPARTHSGTHGGRMLVQMDVYDDDDATCRTSADTLKAWLDNYNGAMGDWSVTIHVRNMPSFWEADARLFRRMLEVEVLYFNHV